MSDINDNVEAYNAELDKLQKRYKEKLRAVLTDAREKYRFTISELILKELFEKAAARKNDEQNKQRNTKIADVNEESGEIAVGENGDDNKGNDEKIVTVKTYATSEIFDKKEIMQKTQEAVKAFAKTALTKVLLEYVKDVQTLNSAFGKTSSGEGFSKTLDLDNLTEGLTAEKFNDTDKATDLNGIFADEKNLGIIPEKSQQVGQDSNKITDNADEINDISQPLGVFCPNNSKEIN